MSCLTDNYPNLLYIFFLSLKVFAKRKSPVMQSPKSGTRPKKIQKDPTASHSMESMKLRKEDVQQKSTLAPLMGLRRKKKRKRLQQAQSDDGDEAAVRKMPPIPGNVTNQSPGMGNSQSFNQTSSTELQGNSPGPDIHRYENWFKLHSSNMLWN